jgi:hypothetical protein
LIIIAAFEAPGVVAGLDDVAVMCEAVEQGCRHFGVAATEYLLLSKRTRQVFETDAGTAWNPSNRPA